MERPGGNALTTNIQLMEAARRNHIPLLGVFFKDELPATIYDGGYIINLQDKSEGGGGTHWTALYVENKNSVYFDSFGAPPPESVKRFVKPIDKQLVYSSKEIQNIVSGVCGYYVLYFLYYMSHRRRQEPNIYRRFKDFQRLWSETPSENRTRLIHYIKPLR